MRRCFLVLVSLILLTFAASAENPAPFALANAQVADRLPAQASDPEALALIASAKAKLLQKPNPLPRLHTEGTLPHQGIYDQSRESAKDLDTILDFALAYRLTGDAAYLDATERFFSAWLAVYHPGFDPIDESHFDRFILAYDLTRAHLSADTQAKMTAFLTTLATGYLAEIKKNEANAYNWQSHRIKLATLAAFALGDAALIEQAHQFFLQHLALNLLADGSVADFHLRDALHYTTYDLEPICVAALASKAHGQDWFHAQMLDHASISGALDWLTPYALGQKTHEEFVHSSVRFDAKREKAGVPGFSGLWDPAHSDYLYQLATALDPKYQAVCDQVLHTKGARANTWLKLLTAAGL